MIKLKTTEEYRTNTEDEAKEAMEYFRKEAHEKGYEIGACGYTYKTKKAKGEIIDSGFLVKVTKIYSTFWD